MLHVLISYIAQHKELSVRNILTRSTVPFMKSWSGRSDCL